MGISVQGTTKTTITGIKEKLECLLKCFQTFDCFGVSYYEWGACLLIHGVETFSFSSYSQISFSYVYKSLKSLKDIKPIVECSFPFTRDGILYLNTCYSPLQSSSSQCLVFYCPSLSIFSSWFKCQGSSEELTKRLYIKYYCGREEVVSTNIATNLNQAFFLIQSFNLTSLVSMPTTWSEFKNGFIKNDYFWLGNEKIHLLTSNLCSSSNSTIHLQTNSSDPIHWRLHIQVVDKFGNWFSSYYNNIIVGNISSNYTLNISRYDGEVSDLSDVFSISKSVNDPQTFKIIPFSTKDHSSVSCSPMALDFFSGWWIDSSRCSDPLIWGFNNFLSTKTLLLSNGSSITPSFTRIYIQNVPFIS